MLNYATYCNNCTYKIHVTTLTANNNMGKIYSLDSITFDSNNSLDELLAWVIRWSATN